MFTNFQGGNYYDGKVYNGFPGPDGVSLPETVWHGLIVNGRGRYWMKKEGDLLLLSIIYIIFFRHNLPVMFPEFGLAPGRE